MFLNSQRGRDAVFTIRLVFVISILMGLGAGYFWYTHLFPPDVRPGFSFFLQYEAAKMVNVFGHLSEPWATYQTNLAESPGLEKFELERAMQIFIYAPSIGFLTGFSTWILAALLLKVRGRRKEERRGVQDILNG